MGLDMTLVINEDQYFVMKYLDLWSLAPITMIKIQTDLIECKTHDQNKWTHSGKKIPMIRHTHIPKNLDVMSLSWNMAPIALHRRLLTLPEASIIQLMPGIWTSIMHNCVWTWICHNKTCVHQFLWFHFTPPCQAPMGPLTQFCPWHDIKLHHFVLGTNIKLHHSHPGYDVKLYQLHPWHWH